MCIPNAFNNGYILFQPIEIKCRAAHHLPDQCARQFSLPLSPVSYLVTENRRRKNQRDGIGADDIVVLDVDAMYYPQKYIDYEGYVHPKGNPQEASFVHPFLLVEITPMCSIISFLKSAI